MRIIERRAIPEPPAPWPINHNVRCPRCESVLHIESEHDYFDRRQERSPNGNVEVKIVCPVCATTTTVRRNPYDLALNTLTTPI